MLASDVGLSHNHIYNVTTELFSQKAYAWKYVSNLGMVCGQNSQVLALAKYYV